MRCVLICAMMCILSAVHAEGVPDGGLVLREGANDVTVSVANMSGADMDGLTLTVDTAQLPSWLTVEAPQIALDASAGENVSGRYVLALTVTGAPEDAVFDIPLSFTDSRGNSWEYTVHSTVGSVAPAEWALIGNSPNPFNPATTIRYALKASSHTRLTVYNSLGQTIRTLADDFQEAGTHEIVWDGRDASGSRVSSGIYLYTLRAGGFSKTMKMLLMQ